MATSPCPVRKADGCPTPVRAALLKDAKHRCSRSGDALLRVVLEQREHTGTMKHPTSSPPGASAGRAGRPERVRAPMNALARLCEGRGDPLPDGRGSEAWR